MADWKRNGNVYSSKNHLDIKKVEFTTSTTKSFGTGNRLKASTRSTVKTMFEVETLDGTKRFSTLSSAKKVAESFTKDDFLNQRADNWLQGFNSNTSIEEHIDKLKSVLSATSLSENEKNEIFNRMREKVGSASRGIGGTSTAYQKQ